MATAVVPDLVTDANSETEQLRSLSKRLRRNGHATLAAEASEPAMQLPQAVYDLLLQIVDGIAAGNELAIVQLQHELTTQQAAEILAVSRPFLVRLLDSGKLPHHLTGKHRRVYRKDLLAYRDYRDRERHDALNRMAQEAESLGIYDKVLLPDK
jgi:excisionase family DNA binding protein